MPKFIVAIPYPPVSGGNRKGKERERFILRRLAWGGNPVFSSGGGGLVRSTFVPRDGALHSIFPFTVRFLNVFTLVALC
jgi:hypothetical protein